MCKTTIEHSQVFIGPFKATDDGEADELTPLDVCAFRTQVVHDQEITKTYKVDASADDDLLVSMVMDVSEHEICRLEVIVSSKPGVFPSILKDARVEELAGRLRHKTRMLPITIPSSDAPVVDFYTDRFTEFLESVADLVRGNRKRANEFAKEIDVEYC